jgi:hypothetical protein
MPDPIRTPMTDVTVRALQSVNPMNTPNMPQRKLQVKKPAAVTPPTPPPPPPVVEEVEETLEENEIELNEIESAIQESKPKTMPESTGSQIIESRSADGLPCYRCEFEGRDIMVGFPCYKTTNPVTAFAMLAMALDYGRDKIRFEMSIGDAMIYHSRNILAQKFLETEAKWLLMMDDDIIPCIGRPAWMRHWVYGARNVLDLPLQRNVLARLIGSNKTLIGGAYFGRQENGTIMCSDLTLGNRAKAYPDEVVPVDWVATGCMLVHRKVFEDIKSKYPELATPQNPSYKFDYFLPTKEGGEDVAFCKRAKASGHQPNIDLGLPVFHVGYKTY